MLRKNKDDLILVLCDFTKESKNAIEHATTIAKKDNDEVRLVHILNRESLQKNKTQGGEAWIREELSKWATENQERTGVKTSFFAKEGSIFTTPGEYAKEVNASLVVLGTHGVKGIQHVVGAFALKVIISISVPVIVVQNRKVLESGYDHIVLPIDDSRFGKNKLGYAISVAKYFDAKIHLYCDYASDESDHKKFKLNEAQAVKICEQNKIPVEVVSHKGRSGSFTKGLISYAVETHADLVVISSQPDAVTMGNIIFGNTETDLINNEAQIPVMCVDPLQDASHVFGDIIFS
jgi:nucleotide-binding universal stress UspA family protein